MICPPDCKHVGGNSLGKYAECFSRDSLWLVINIQDNDIPNWSEIYSISENALLLKKTTW